MGARAAELAGWARERFPDLRAEPLHGLDMEGMTVSPGSLVELGRALRDEAGFSMLTDLSGVDRMPAEPRFEVNYHLLAMDRMERLRVKVRVPETDARLPSVVDVWPGADWQEREVYDLFGITFDGHPNLARILMPEEWEGHPLRKDYPTGGVPVEYRIEPAYVSASPIVTDTGRGAAGGPPPRLTRAGRRRSLWTWTGPPAAGVRGRGSEPAEPEPGSAP